MLVKSRKRLTYLVSKNSQIRLWHRRLEYISNTSIVKASKLTDRIDITIKDSQPGMEEQFSSDLEEEIEDKNSEPNLDNNK